MSRVKKIRRPPLPPPRLSPPPRPTFLLSRIQYEPGNQQLRLPPSRLCLNHSHEKGRMKFRVRVGKWNSEIRTPQHLPSPPALSHSRHVPDAVPPGHCPPGVRCTGVVRLLGRTACRGPHLRGRPVAVKLLGKPRIKNPNKTLGPKQSTPC